MTGGPGGRALVWLTSWGPREKIAGPPGLRSTRLSPKTWVLDGRRHYEDRRRSWGFWAGVLWRFSRLEICKKRNAIYISDSRISQEDRISRMPTLNQYKTWLMSANWINSELRNTGPKGGRVKGCEGAWGAMSRDCLVVVSHDCS